MHALKQQGQISWEARCPQGWIYPPPTAIHTHGNHGNITTTTPPASCLGSGNQVWPTSSKPMPELMPGWPWSGCRKNWDWAIWSVQMPAQLGRATTGASTPCCLGLGSDGA